MTWRDIAAGLILKHEGFRPHPYHDSRGIATIGIGRNLEAKGLTRHEALGLMDDDIDDAISTLDAVLPTWSKLSANRMAALVDATFDLEHRIGGFHQMLAALDAGDFARAAAELRDSDFGRECPERVAELARLIELG